MMEQEFVSRRQWISREKFLDLVGAANLIPGPSSSEVAIYIGQLLAGAPGLVIAGICFILPAAVIVLGFAYSYARFGSLPQVTGILYGIKPVIIAIVIQATYQLGITALKSKKLIIIGIGAFILNALGLNILMILLSGGIASALILGGPGWRGGGFMGMLALGASSIALAAAVGQFTPGPVFTTATFIGYLLRGTSGAVAATIGIFLPAFVLVSVSGPLIPRIRKSVTAGAFLDGINVASLALLAFVTWGLGMAAVVDYITLIIAGLSAFLLFRYKLNSAWLVLSGGILGYFVTAMLN